MTIGGIKRVIMLDCVWKHKSRQVSSFGIKINVSTDGGEVECFKTQPDVHNMI